MSTSQSMSSGVDLPEDIVVRILCRLPVKSLIRFSCVSKLWLSIISDPKFRKSHFQLASQLRTISTKILLISYPCVREPGPRPNATYDPTTYLPSRFQTLDNKLSSVKTFTLPAREQLVGMRVFGSCNGLLILGRYGDKNLCVWNLSTGFFREISVPCLERKSKYLAGGPYYFINSGFGYVSASDDYKLVFIVPAVGDMLEIHVFSLKANIWRVITAPYSSWPGWKSGQGTFVNGAIHWVIDSRNETSDPVIYAFDLAEEELQKVTLPPALWQNEEGNNRTVITTVVHLGGYLCICSQKRYNPTECEVWAMKVYGMPESWVKLLRFDIHDIPDVFTKSYPSWHLGFITESGTMMIEMYEELFWIECLYDKKPICTRRYRLEKVRPNDSLCSFYFNAIGYDETLVSVE